MTEPTVSSDSRRDPLLIEVTRLPTGDALVEAGLRGRAHDATVATRAIVGDSLERAITTAGDAVIAAVSSLATPPAEVEVTFGLKATAEGNVFVGKGAAEANFNVSLMWRSPLPNPD